MVIYMSQPQVQAMISYNKKLITNLTDKQKDLKNSIQLLWKASDPMNTNVDSQSAFSCMNIMKNQLRKITHDIKVLAEAQNALKKASFY